MSNISFAKSPDRLKNLIRSSHNFHTIPTPNSKTVVVRCRGVEALRPSGLVTLGIIPEFSSMYQGQAPMSTLAGSQIQQQSAAQAQPFVAQPKKPRRRVLTSLTLEVFVYFGGWWDVFYFIVNIIVFVWKGERRQFKKMDVISVVHQVPKAMQILT